MVFEGLFLKANMLWRLRRQREALIVSEGARSIAAENGMTDELLRIMIGVANALGEFDMGQSVDATREVMAIARRTGRRDELFSAVSNFGYSGFIAGVWDEALSELEAALVEDVPAGHRRVMVNNWADIRASRGENVDQAILEMERLEEGATERAKIFRLDTQAQDLAARGDYKGASKAYQRTMEISPSETNEVSYRSGRLELWAGDLEEARRLFAVYGQQDSQSRC